DFAHRRSPQRAHACTRDVARALGIELRRLAATDDDDARLLVERVHAVEPRDSLFLLLETRDGRSRRPREPCGGLGASEEGNDDRVDLADLRGTNSTKFHWATFFRATSVATRSRAC